MNKFLIKGIIFSIPFFICWLFILIIDPYEFISLSHIIKSEDKIKVYWRSNESSPRGTIFWKVIHYEEMPEKNIIIGDSQGVNFNDSVIKDISGKDFFNFCVPGSSYETMFQTFWYATEKIKLECVYFQVGFMNYNANRSYNIFHFAQDYINKPYLYFISKDILFDSFYNLIYQIYKNPKLVQRPDEHHNYEVLDKLSSYRLNLFFKDYKYPEKYFVELKRITDYCKKNSIEIKFIIFPTYKETQEYLKNNNLLSMKAKFKHDIKSLAYTYDYDIPSNISIKRENFMDYFHPRDHVVDELTKKIWSQ